MRASGRWARRPSRSEATKTMIGGGAQVAINRAAELAGVALDPITQAQVLARFYETYATASAEGRGLYPGATELLGSLRDTGIAMAICTNKAQHIAEIAVRALGIADFFRIIVGARDGQPKKPDRAPIMAALTGLNQGPDYAIMVGDSAADIGAAKAAGIPSIAVAHGYAKGPVSELGADLHVADLTGVAPAIATLAERWRGA
ncbi:MAG: HAD-IA family hydrolase [Hyphomicrobiaceae bacterium]